MEFSGWRALTFDWGELIDEKVTVQLVSFHTFLAIAGNLTFHNKRILISSEKSNNQPPKGRIAPFTSSRLHTCQSPFLPILSLFIISISDPSYQLP